MPCGTLQHLHEEATLTRQQLAQTRATARETAQRLRMGRAAGANEFEGFLHRKLQRLAAEIEGHKAEHGCE